LFPNSLINKDFGNSVSRKGKSATFGFLFIQQFSSYLLISIFSNGKLVVEDSSMELPCMKLKKSLLSSSQESWKKCTEVCECNVFSRSALLKMLFLYGKTG